MTSRWADLNNQQKLERVKPLLGDHLSFEEIAGRLAAPSRASIAGFVFRMRQAGSLPPTKPRRKRLPQERKAKPRSPNPKPNKPLMKAANGLLVPIPMRGPNNPHRNDFKGRAEQRAASPGIEIRREFAFDPLPDTPPVPFLTNTGCRWPVDGVNGPGLMVCGADKDFERPYCDAHRHLSYQSPSTRQADALRSAERMR